MTSPARIVHLGLGAFFRAHGAIYFSELDTDWGTIGVSLRRPDIRNKLRPQGFAYMATERTGSDTHIQHIKIIRDVLVAPENPSAVLAAMADPSIEIVSLTVTEKGYCHDPATGTLNLNHPDIEHDMTQPMPRSAPGMIVRALEMRRDRGLPAFTILSCDNLNDNGALVRRVVTALAQEIDPMLAAWITENATFPSTMVDRIVPATTPDDVAQVARLSGQPDAAPVLHEPFRQWVIEDHFAHPRPPLDSVGVQFVQDVAPFENMKLRMLNGAHSALAYIGYLAGHKTVSAAVADPAIAAYIKNLWTAEIIPTLSAPPDTSLPAYADALMARFANPAMQHSTWQIAMDGSQKLPQRILATIKDARTPTPGLLKAVAAWMIYVSGTDEAGQAIDIQDPFAAQLAKAANSDDPVTALLSIRDIFDPAISAKIDGPLRPIYQNMRAHGVRAALDS